MTRIAPPPHAWEAIRVNVDAYRPAEQVLSGAIRTNRNEQHLAHPFHMRLCKGRYALRLTRTVFHGQYTCDNDASTLTRIASDKCRRCTPYFSTLCSTTLLFYVVFYYLAFQVGFQMPYLSIQFSTTLLFYVFSTTLLSYVVPNALLFYLGFRLPYFSWWFPTTLLFYVVFD